MQYMFLICSRTGCKKYVPSDVFLQPALKRIKKTYSMGKRLFLYLDLACWLLVLHRCVQSAGAGGHYSDVRGLVW